MADNTLKNTDLVTKWAVKDFINALQLGAKVDRQIDTTAVFSKKVGAAIRIRRPVMFEASDGEVIEAGETSDVEEATVLVALDQRKKVVFNFTSEELTLNIEEARERYIKPSMVELAQQVESVIADSYKAIYNLVGTPGTSPGSFLVVANAGAKLDNLGVPMDDDRSSFFDPNASVTLADSLRTVFPQEIAKKAIEQAAIGRYGGFNLFRNQSLKIHTPGVNTGTPLINGADQNTAYLDNADTNSQSLITDGWTINQTGIVVAGDVYTLAGVNSVNRRTREDTGELAQFVVLADANSDGSGNATILTSPPIIIDGPYQTVTDAPADGAQITIISSLTPGDGLKHRQNLAFHKNAITLATAQLDLPTDGASASRENFMGISIRAVRQYNITLDKNIFRFDILFTVKVQNPGFAVRTTS